MSNAAMTCCLQAADRPAQPGARFVLFVLADHASDHSGEDWTCFPSVARIMDYTGFSRATVERHLIALYDAGWISRKRRVRADGRLGVYDYVIHRHPDIRGDLRARRHVEGDLADAILGDVAHAAECSVGPCRNLTHAMPQIDSSPRRKLQHEEPLEEPSTEPPHCAREPGDDGFERAFEIWPESGLRWTNEREARAAFALVAAEIGAADLIERIARYATEDGGRSGDYGAPSLQKWLSEGRWRHWASRQLADVLPTRIQFAGPLDLRAALIDAGIPENTVDRCGWIEPGGLRAPTSWAFDKIRDAAGHVLRARGFDLISPQTSLGGLS